MHILQSFCIAMFLSLFRHNKTPKVFCLTFGVHVTERGLDYILVSTFLNSAHRAWLPYQSDMAPVGFSLAIGGRGDGLTGIEDVQVKFNGKKVIYDIHGRRVSRMVSPGLYIVNREKVLVK